MSLDNLSSDVFEREVKILIRSQQIIDKIEGVDRDKFTEEYRKLTNSLSLIHI